MPIMSLKCGCEYIFSTVDSCESSHNKNVQGRETGALKNVVESGSKRLCFVILKMFTSRK